MMVSLMELWLPILLATILIFVASAVMWMVMPHHRTDWQSMPNGERVQEPREGRRVGCARQPDRKRFLPGDA